MFYYTYRIDFEDGHYYYGSRKSNVPPEQDTGYTGSPKTNKSYWVNPFSKTVLKSFDDKDSMLLAEYMNIGNKHKTDTLCLNRHNTKTFSAVDFHWWVDSEGKEVFAHGNNVLPGWKIGRPSVSKKQLGIKRPDVSKAICGIKRSDETKQKISKRAKERVAKEDYVNPMSIQRVKQKHAASISTVKYKKKVSQGLKTKWSDQEWKNRQVQERRERVLKEDYVNPMSKAAYVDGVCYKSISSAMRATGLSRPKIKELQFIA